MIAEILENWNDLCAFLGAELDSQGRALIQRNVRLIGRGE